MQYQAYFKYLAGLLLLGFSLSSCFDDLNVEPIDPDLETANVVYEDSDSYRQVLAKLYAGLSLSGQEGPSGNPDIQGIDEGFSTYLRQYWKAQVLTTDEAVIAWNDGNIHDYEEMDWDAANEFVRAMYDRMYFQIALCNEFLRESTEEKLNSRGQEDLKAEVQAYRAEARFLRALSYWHALDMFRTVPFVLEADGVGFYQPEQIEAADLFTWLEEEIKAIDQLMVAPSTNEYGRADQGALWMLAAKLYQNASVYIGEDKSSEALTYLNRVIAAGYTLDDNYQHMFLADNDSSPEIIFPITFDGNNGRTFGGTTFLVHAAVGGDMSPADFGIDNGWGGLRTTSALVEKFPAVGGTLVESRFGEGADFATLNVPGGYQGWDAELETTVLASPADDNQYSGYLYFPEAGAIKFALGSWATNWGDNENDGILEETGGDINVEAGFFRITVDLDALTYTITPADWGLIGDATPGGWDSDTDMTYNVEENAWEITLDLTGGAVKFRMNDAWDINLGDDDSDGLLEGEGANITIPGGGNYTIKLYLGEKAPTYSIVSNTSDNRKMFFTENQTLEIEDVTQFNQGYAIAKFKNLNQDGTQGSHPTYVDNDFALFRLADAHLMYAEAVLRGGTGGDLATAVTYVNAIRARSGAGPISESELTLDFLLDERARELYWEAHRRTDLIRFGKFTGGDYVWPLKGNALEGTSVPAFRDIFPIPLSDLAVNAKLSQNPGY